MDEPTQPLPEPLPTPVPEQPAPSVLAADPRGWPTRSSAKSNKTLIGVAIGGCTFIFLGFLACVGLLGWLGYRAAEQDRANREHGKPSAAAPAIGGKPGGTSDGRSTDPRAWISSDDYPPDALDRGEEGIVAIAWEVSPDGLPLRCTVEQSSGHSSLDTAACAAIMRHARYPALPAGAVSVRRETRRVVWRLPANDASRKE